MGIYNDDISLKLAKAVKQGFLPDVSDSEVDILRAEASFMVKSDASLAHSSMAEVKAPAVLSLIGGQPDETLTVTNCTVSADTINKRFGVQAWKLTMAGAVTATAKLPALTNGVINEPISSVSIMIYVPDITKVTGLTVQLYTGATDVNYYNFNITVLRLGLAGNLKNGWNIVRWTPSHKTITGSPLAFGNVDHVRAVVVTNAATDVTIQQVAIQTRPKASILFIHDGGYTLWDRSPGYFDLRKRNVPVTWSVDTGLIGDATHVTDTRLREISQENRNSISFHGWDGSDTTVMTNAQVQAHTMQAIKWLSVRGYTGRIWRSAWLQNSAPNAEATNEMVLVNPMFGTEGQERIQSWPFHDRYGVSRIAIQGKDQAGIDAIFTELKANHGVAVLYTHRVRDGFVADITPAMWLYFLNKYDEGVSEGWLEAVTLEMLLEGSGIKIKQGMGGTVTAEWPGVDGTTTVKYLP